MSNVRLPVEIGIIRDLTITTGISENRNKYILKASTHRFQETIYVGEWYTLEEALEEFRIWDEVRKEQYEEVRRR